VNPELWSFLNQAGPLALLGWAVINERRITRLEVTVQTLADAMTPRK
jgi:hypothetical protein